MKEPITIEVLKEKLDFLKTIYDSIRIIDPLRKIVMDQDGNSIKETNEICYKYWSSQKICDNCIAMRAYIENDTFMKLENTKEKLFMVTAIPTEINEHKIILELFKDVTDTMMVGNGEYVKGISLKNSLTAMNNMVVRDDLTNIFNRRYISERLPADIVKSVIERKPLSILIADIDRFKEINDNFGHNAGDMVIKEIANTLLGCIRGDTDWVARYGGDEFLICLNNTSNDSAYNIAERMRKKIEEKIIQFENKKIKIFASFGIFTMFEKQLASEEIIALADKNLYKAKKRGRNTVVK
ncbi:MAG: diguanylate cyclase [Clostridium argentinense]|uniref:diguanylate cyclase n=1 Tax=uncultured Clostridium sp. TaxID=59620 RepID=UPI001D5E1EA0|nr:diguanylate cyclase [uncultured Clostridium sp.]MBS5825274.1 diguanylate cyclase [Clostridium argentinense]MDU1350331.1 diguanylate cyclase [Clostridium argentinense]